MTDSEIIDIILDDLKVKSPRNLIKDILQPRLLWSKVEEQRIKNILSVLTSKNLITDDGGKKLAGVVQISN